MKINQDFVSLQLYEKDDKSMYSLLGAGITSQASIYALSDTSKLVKLTPSQLQALMSSYPDKVTIKLGQTTRTVANYCMDRNTTKTINNYLSLSCLDLWLHKNEAEFLLKQPVKKISALETEKKSMLKMILGMAMAHHGFDPRDPSRKSASGCNTGSIKSDLEKYGISIGTDTVRKYLNESSDAYINGEMSSKAKTT